VYPHPTLVVLPQATCVKWPVAGDLMKTNGEMALAG